MIDFCIPCHNTAPPLPAADMSSMSCLAADGLVCFPDAFRGSRCLVPGSLRARKISAATRLRCGDGRDDLCAGIVFRDPCTRASAAGGVKPLGRTISGCSWKVAADKPAALLGVLMERIYSYEPGLVRIICDMLVYCEMAPTPAFMCDFVCFVGPFDLMGGELRHTTPHSSCHHACAKCPRCTLPSLANNM